MNLQTPTWRPVASHAIIRPVSRAQGTPTFPNRLREIRKAKGWTLEIVAEKLNTTAATISRRESGLVDLSAADIATYIRVFGVSYEEIYPDPARDSLPPADLTPEINRLCDELGMDVVDQMPAETPRAVKLRVLRTATERFRAAAAELLILKRGGKASS